MECYESIGPCLYRAQKYLQNPKGKYWKCWRQYRSQWWGFKFSIKLYKLLFHLYLYLYLNLDLFVCVLVFVFEPSIDLITMVGFRVSNSLPSSCASLISARSQRGRKYKKNKTNIKTQSGQILKKVLQASFPLEVNGVGNIKKNKTNIKNTIETNIKKKFCKPHFR